MGERGDGDDDDGKGSCLEQGSDKDDDCHGDDDDRKWIESDEEEGGEMRRGRAREREERWMGEARAHLAWAEADFDW